MDLGAVPVKVMQNRHECNKASPKVSLGCEEKVVRSLDSASILA